MSQSTSTTLAERAMSLCRAEPFPAVRASPWQWADHLGDDGVTYCRQTWLWRWTGDFFFPLRSCEAAMLKEGVSDHCHQCMPMKARPGSSFEVIEPKLFLELPMGLLADPARLDRAGERFDRRVGGRFER